MGAGKFQPQPFPTPECAVSSFVSTLDGRGWSSEAHKRLVCPWGNRRDLGRALELAQVDLNVRCTELLAVAAQGSVSHIAIPISADGSVPSMPSAPAGKRSQPEQPDGNDKDPKWAIIYNARKQQNSVGRVVMGSVMSGTLSTLVGALRVPEQQKLLNYVADGAFLQGRGK